MSRIVFGTRKLQKIRYSFTVAIPPQWVRHVGLEQNGSVELRMNNDDTLLIVPLAPKTA